MDKENGCLGVAEHKFQLLNTNVRLPASTARGCSFLSFLGSAFHGLQNVEDSGVYLTTRL